MIINRENLAAVRTGFNTAFSKGLGVAPSQYQRIATIVPASVKEVTYGWLGKIPSVREWLGPRVVQTLAEHSYSIREKKWELTLAVDKDDIETDNIGVYGPLFEEMGQSTGSHWETLVWSLLASGFATNCYDGQFFFDTDHPVLGADGAMVSIANTDGGAGAAWFLIDDSRALKPIILQKRKDFNFVSKDKDTDDNVFDNNEFVYGADARANAGFGFWQFAWGSKQTLDFDHYGTARTALLSMKADHGRPLGVKPRLLIVGPSNEKRALEIVNAERNAAGADNVYKGTAEVMVVPWLA